MWKLEGKMRNTLVGIIQSRLTSKDSGYGNDLLGLMMDSNMKKEGMGLNMNEIIDECKSFFLAGQETTAHLLTWTVFLLSTYQEWQEKLREEVVQECGMEIPCIDNLNKLKLVTLIITIKKFPKFFYTSYLTQYFCRFLWFSGKL